MGAGYAEIRRRLEILIDRPEDDGKRERELSLIREKFDWLADNSPNVPERIRRRVLDELRKRPEPDRVVPQYMNKNPKGYEEHRSL